MLVFFKANVISISSHTLFIQVDSYQCDCPPGFVGYHCDIDQRRCGSDPCLNGGQCLQFNDGTYICNCSKGFTGNQCNPKRILQSFLPM